MRRGIPLIVLASLAFAPAPVYRPKSDPAQADLEAMQGEWVLLSTTKGGKTVPGGGWTMILTGSQGKYVRPDGEDAIPWTISLEAKVEPRSFTAGRAWRGSAKWQGIYKLKGNTLTLCATYNDDPPPATFAAPQEGTRLEVFARKKR